VEKDKQTSQMMSEENNSNENEDDVEEEANNDNNIFGGWPWNVRSFLALPPTPLLYQFVRNQLWERAIERIMSNPEEIAFSDTMDNRYTALHIACQRNPPIAALDVLIDAYLKYFPSEATNAMVCKYHIVDIRSPLHLALDRHYFNRSNVSCSLEAVQALLRKLPHLTRAKYRGEAPIHQLCLNGGSVEFVELLLQSDPQSILCRDNYGNTPLLCAISSSLYTQRQTPTYEMLQLLLQACPEAATMPDYRGVTPLKHIMKVCFPTLLGTTTTISKVHPKESPLTLSSDSFYFHSPDFVLFWKKIKLLLCAIHRRNITDVDTPKFKCLHAVTTIASTVPVQLFQFASIIHASEAMEKDYYDDFEQQQQPQKQKRTNNHHGRLPLSIAAASPTLRGIKCSHVIKCLLNANSKAASVPDNQGRLPLTLAILTNKSWEWCLRFLLDAAPHSISMIDPSTQMYPFMLAAAIRPPPILNNASSEEEEEEEHSQSCSATPHPYIDNVIFSLSNTYRLLREAPYLVAAQLKC
jgi:hypothetical protein